MKTTVISIVVAGVLIGGAIMLAGGNRNPGTTAGAELANNVSIVDGKQIITINAKGGYSPRVTTAKAGLPTVIKVDTQGTFDCSSALTIPSIGYQKNLPPSGVTDIEIPPQKASSKLQGLCAMGMYNFAVNFN
mgnify:FL=1